MPSPVRYPSGVSTAAKSSTLFNMPAEDPTKLHKYWNDFDTYAAGDWTITKIGAGGTVALTDVDGGGLLVTSDALDNDGVQLQKVGEGFLPASGKKLWIKARLKMTKSTQSDFLIGLAVTDTTLLGAVDGDGVTDGIFFTKEDGDQKIDFYVQKNTTTGQKQTLDIARLADDTFVTLGAEFDGKRYVNLYVNDVKVSTVDLTTTPSTYLPDTECTISFAYLNGEAGASPTTIDYILVAQER